jgi:uncharacterized protein YjgD (DUF1641 family)
MILIPQKSSQISQDKSQFKKASELIELADKIKIVDLLISATKKTTCFVIF